MIIGHWIVSLLCCKTRAKPLKTKMTLPNLELNGALLLRELVASVISTLQLEEAPVYCWSNSTIVLSWLKKEPTELENYVANWVAKIQDRSKRTRIWRHVKSKENHADCASRGISPGKLRRHNLWWKGCNFCLIKMTKSKFFVSQVRLMVSTC